MSLPPHLWHELPPTPTLSSFCSLHQSPRIRADSGSYHALSWPQLSYVAVDVSRPKKTPYDYPRIVGYVLAKMEEDVRTLCCEMRILFLTLHSLRMESSTATSPPSVSCGRTAVWA